MPDVSVPDAAQALLDAVLCPACLTVITDFGDDEDRWGSCPNCPREVDSDEAVTVRQMLDGYDTGPTWNDVDLPRWSRALRAALAAADTPKPDRVDLVVRLPEDLHAELKARADQEDRSMAAVIRLALRAYAAAADGSTPDLIALATEAIRNPHEHTPRGPDGLDVARWQARAVLAALGTTTPTQTLWEGPIEKLRMSWAAVAGPPGTRVRVVVATPATENQHG